MKAEHCAVVDLFVITNAAMIISGLCFLYRKAYVISISIVVVVYNGCDVIVGMGGDSSSRTRERKKFTISGFPFFENNEHCGNKFSVENTVPL